MLLEYLDEACEASGVEPDPAWVDPDQVLDPTTFELASPIVSESMFQSHEVGKNRGRLANLRQRV
jgi:hypothetical protein